LSPELTQCRPARLMPAPRAVPFLDVEDMEILFEHNEKIVRNVRAKHLMRNELMAWSELKDQAGKCGLPIINAF
jgi:hypothetical protein